MVNRPIFIMGSNCICSFYFFLFWLLISWKNEAVEGQGLWFRKEEVVQAPGHKCPNWTRFGHGPPETCPKSFDPLNKSKSRLESWFTREMFTDLFPKANLGWGPHHCFPYNYDSFIIAARYFPRFGADRPSTTNPHDVNDDVDDISSHGSEAQRRDLAAFFAHAVQETGENDASVYDTRARNKTEADACFYRGGFFNWFEGGPVSSFLPKSAPGLQPSDGDHCTLASQYCLSSDHSNLFYPCNNESIERMENQNEEKVIYSKGCYFGRGVIQISYNYNYGQFQRWLLEQGLDIDLLTQPNLVMTKTDPPLSFMASLWFYMTPQPPKPSMHDIIMGNWEPGHVNRKAGYSGGILGPTSLVINNECGGEDEGLEPGGPGENRRIKAFKWFCQYLGVKNYGSPQTLSCQKMPQSLKSIPQNISWQPDWTSTWRPQPCK